jgi:tmRNA-binding protein
VELGLCKGKRLYDKREAEAERQMQRDIERERLLDFNRPSF